MLMSAAAAATDVYKWVDEQGTVHFGDRPPTRDATAVEVQTAAPASDGQARYERTRRTLDALTTEREEREDQRRALKDQAAKRKQNCSAAQKEQYRREHAANLFYRDESGEKRVLEGAEYDAEIERARQAVREWCG